MADKIYSFFVGYNNDIAIITLGILSVAFIIVMIISEWKRGENWWRE